MIFVTLFARAIAHALPHAWFIVYFSVGVILLYYHITISLKSDGL